MAVRCPIAWYPHYVICNHPADCQTMSINRIIYESRSLWITASQTTSKLLHCCLRVLGGFVYGLHLTAWPARKEANTHTNKKKSPLRCGSFVTLMIIYNSQVVCLCGPHSAAAWRLPLPCIFGKQYQMASKQKKRERVWIRQDFYKCGIISDDIALTNTVPHHYVCLPADCQRSTVPQILTVSGACGLITEVCHLICLPASHACLLRWPSHDIMSTTVFYFGLKCVCVCGGGGKEMKLCKSDRPCFQLVFQHPFYYKWSMDSN